MANSVNVSPPMAVKATMMPKRVGQRRVGALKSAALRLCLIPVGAVVVGRASPDLRGFPVSGLSDDLLIALFKILQLLPSVTMCDVVRSLRKMPQDDGWPVW